MTQEHKDFLFENINNWHTAQNGYVRNLDLPLLKMYEHIYRTYLNTNFVLTHWCGGCKMEMITRLYKYYESLPIENLVFKNEASENDQRLGVEVKKVTAKKRGPKPKNNG